MSISSAPIPPNSLCACRMKAKAGQVQASVFDGTGATVALKRENLVEKWVPDADLPKNLFDPEGYWVACNYYINTPGFNTNLIPRGTEPKTFEDLLDPKWKGKMAWNVQPSISAGQGFVGSVLIAMGEDKARAYLAKLAKQNIAPLQVSGRQVLDLVIAGEYPIGLQIFNNHAFISASKGAPVDWIKMQPPLITYSVMSVPKGAPNPNAGKLLIDYIVSLEGQKIIADAGELPVHPGVKAARSHARARRRDLQGVVSHPRRTGPESRTLDENVRRVFSLKLPAPQRRRLRNGALDDTNRKERNLDQRVLRQHARPELDRPVEPARQPRERIHQPRLLGRRGADRRARPVRFRIFRRYERRSTMSTRAVRARRSNAPRCSR